MAVYNDQGYFKCEANYPNDILESGNIIVSFGKNSIEFFDCSQINNNNDKINDRFNITNKLVKIYEIPYSYYNFHNFYNLKQILCIELYNNFIICGHKNGYLSTWLAGGNSYLKMQGEMKVSDNAINKITTIILENKDYLLLCCSDKTIKLFSITSCSVEKISQQFEDEIMDLKKVKNQENKDLIIISLKNGLIKVLNTNLIPLFDMNSRFGIRNTRKVISMKNPSPAPDKGDFIFVTEGNRIDVFVWIKPGSFKSQVQNQNLQQPHRFNPHQNFQYPRV